MKCSLLTLSCYVDSELPAPRKGELEAHLVGCHRCRAGLGHLREEVERVEGLARVHLPESSVRLLLEHTGLIAAGDPMPAVADPGAAAELPSSTPPWLRGGAGAALPWASARPPSPPRPGAAVPPPGGPVEPPPPLPSSTPDTFDVWAAARVEAPPDAAPPPAEAPPPPPPEAPPESRASRRRARAEARRQAAAAEHLPTETIPSIPSTPFAPSTDPPPEVSAGASEGPAEPPPAAAAPPSSTSEPVLATGTESAAAAVPPAGGDAVPVWTPESSVETPPVPRYPLTDDDALEEPTTVERFGPMPAPRPGVVDRIRERLALRRALRVAALDDRGDGIEIVSGPGAPMRGPRSRGDLARRRSEALRPASRPDGGPWDGDGESPALQEPPTRREPTVDELLPPPARPSSLGRAAAPTPAPAAEPAVDEEWPAWRPTQPAEGPRRRRATAAAAAAAEATAPPPPGGTAAGTVDGRRLTVVLGTAILLMFVVGVASARSTSPLPVTSGQAPAVSAPQRQAVAPPPAPTAAAVQPAPRSAVALPGLTGTVSVGDGATGWSVQDIRYGAHAGYLRMVLDLVPAGGAATGSPKVTIGFQDPTTLIIDLDQVTARGAPAAPLAGGLVTSISLLTPAPAAGSTAYVVKLAHAVQFTPAYAASPLRLILDLH